MFISGMVLEEFLDTKNMKKQILYAFVGGIIFTALGLLVSLVTFTKYASLMLIFYVSLPYMIILNKILIKEEKIREKKVNSMKEVCCRNRNIITIFFNFFFGCTLVFFLAYVFLPPALTQYLFKFQVTYQLSDITSGFLGNAFSTVLLNNLEILFFVFLLSFIYGVGAIMVIVWNASVLGAFLGSWVKQGLPLIPLFYLPHTIIEFIAYFLAATAGGLISAFIVHGNIKKYRNLIPDLVVLLSLSVIYILAGAALESIVLSLVG
jgi:uncharacterized membrane protein SpoIIM required for sporulation